MIWLISLLLICLHLRQGLCFRASRSDHFQSTTFLAMKPTRPAPFAAPIGSRQSGEAVYGSNEGIILQDFHNSKSRRSWIQNAIFAAGGLVAVPMTSVAATDEDVLPLTLRDYTKLAPLGPKESKFNSPPKSTNLSPEEIAKRLTKDLVEGATGKGGYFLTGDLSRDLFRDDCVFEDPTNRVNSLSQYQKALTLLFDPESSTVELLGDGLTVVRERCLDKDNRCVTTIRGRLRSRGYLKVAPWKPYVKAYETTIVYTLDPDTNLVARQDQTWTKGASEALKETFTPSWNGAAPKSMLSKPEKEPPIVTKLFQILNGRRPNEYSTEERAEIDALLDQVARLPPTDTASLTGTWFLVYLQQGPEGAGIDRRIPFFPEFDFNDSFQVFSASSSQSSADRVTNVGQVLGSLADVRVSGTLNEIATETNTPNAGTQKRRFEANIQGGKLCLDAPVPSPKESKTANCPIDLPMIQGKGLFESIYLGERLRIGQNINGGGARVVQVRLS